MKHESATQVIGLFQTDRDEFLRKDHEHGGQYLTLWWELVLKENSRAQAAACEKAIPIDGTWKKLVI